MAENFNIKSTAEWEGAISSLKDASDAMDYAAELMRKTVYDNLLEQGLTGDIVQKLMDAYENDVLSNIKKFKLQVESFVKAHERMLEGSHDLNKNLNNKVDEMNLNKKRDLSDLMEVQ